MYIIKIMNDFFKFCQKRLHRLNSYNVYEKHDTYK